MRGGGEQSSGSSLRKNKAIYAISNVCRLFYNLNVEEKWESPDSGKKNGDARKGIGTEERVLCVSVNNPKVASALFSTPL